MGCINSKASTSIREEVRLRHGFQSRSNAQTAPHSKTSHNDSKTSLSFHTVEEYDALLDRIRARDSLGVEMQESRWREDASEETGSRRKAVARGLKALEVEFPAIATLLHSPAAAAGTYVTPKFGSYNAPTAITMPQNAVFSLDLLAAFEDCMQRLQLEEDAILEHMFQL